MSRIHRYVLIEMIGPTLVGLLAYGLILLMNLSLEAAEMAIRRDLPIAIVLRFILLSLPRILVLTLPMAVLVGVLVSAGRLASDGEILALRSLGYDERRLVIPAALLGLLAAGLTWVVFESAVPAANYQQHQLQAQIFVSSDLNREIQPRTFFEKIPNLLVYAEDTDPSDGTLEQVLLYQKTPEGDEEISSAKRARIEYQEGRGALNFRLEDVVSHEWDRTNPDTYQVAHREEETIVRPPDIFTTEMLRSLKEPPPRNLREQNVTQLRETIEELRKLPKGTARRRLLNEARVEYHKKFSIPTTCFVFAILGMAIALSQRRGGRTAGFLISLLVIVIQYFLLTAGEQMADRGRISPALAMWGGNAAFGLLALFLLAAGPRLSWDLGGLFSLRARRRAAAPPPAPPAVASGSRPDPSGAADGPVTTGRPAAGRRRFLLRWIPAIDRYLLKTLFSVSILVLLSLSLLFALFASLDLIDEITKGTQPLSMLFVYVANALPQFITSYVLPVGLCVSTMITFALLSRTHELVALRSAGIGPFRISALFVFVAAVTAAASFGASDSVLPATNQKAAQLRDLIRGRSPRSYKQPERRWVFGSNGDLVTFADFNRERNEILDIGVLKFRPRSFLVKDRVYAERAVWEEGGWLLSNGWERSFQDDKERFEPFSTRRIEDMDGPDYFAQEWKAPDQMNIGQLKVHLADMEKRGHDTRDLRLSLHRKMAIPAVCLVMVLIALPFGLRSDRRGALGGLGIALLIAAVYFFAMQAAGKLGEVGVLPPFLAAWGPNLLFSGASLYLMAGSRW